jgi:hypothetical protein
LTTEPFRGLNGRASGFLTIVEFNRWKPFSGKEVGNS